MQRTQKHYIDLDGVLPSAAVVDRLAEIGRPVLLSFSAGKDAVGCWLALRDRVEVIPFYGYLVPDLEFVESGLVYYEQFFGQRIIRLPHPFLYSRLNSFTFQPPDRLKVIEERKLENYDWALVAQVIHEDYKLEPTFTCTGVRAADSPNRRSGFRAGGSIAQKTMRAFPVWDWLTAKLQAELIRAGVKLTVDYDMFGRSFDGIDYRFLKPIKDRFPQDYAKILEWFPLADLEIFRAEKLCKN